jgi:hypothetical protein
MVLAVPVLYGLHRNFRLSAAMILVVSVPALTILWVILSSTGTGAIVTDAESRQGGFDFGALMLELMSGQYWQHSLENSRLWLLVEGFRATFLEFRPLGFGPDEQRALEAFAESSSERVKILDYFAYKDVYWIALAIHLGILGLATYLAILYVGWRRAHMATNDTSHRRVQVILALCSVYLVIFFAGSFAERLPVLRPTAFFFWFSCALLVKFSARMPLVALRPGLAAEREGRA